LSIIFVALTAGKLAPGVPYWVWAVLMACGITVVNLRGIRVTARANTALNALMVGSLVWFVTMAVAALARGVGEGTLFSSRPFYNPAEFEPRAILGAASLAALSFLGFDGISTLAEDARDPGRDILRATVIVCFVAGALFVLQSYLGQLVWPEFRTFSPVETAFVDIAGRVGGTTLYWGVSFILLVGGLASAITGQASASRLLVGMARDGLLPRRLFAYVHPRLGTPVYSVILMGTVHLAGALFLRYGEAAELVNFGALCGFMLVNLAVVRHFAFRGGARRWVQDLLLPGAGFAVCGFLWVNLSRFAIQLGFVWLGVGFAYLLVLTHGFRRPLATLKL